jgi:putative Holliday junction resolvase
MSSVASVYLCFDYGEKNIGVAVGQSVSGTATALETIRATDNQSKWNAISRLVETWRPDAFVVGIPLPYEGNENPILQPIQRFCRQLEGRYRLPVHTMDETLSTAESRELFYQTPNRRRGERFADNKDRIAAQLILQTWLCQPTISLHRADETSA